MPTRPPPEWLPSITQVEFIMDEEAFIQIANHCFDFEGTFLSRHPAPVGPPISARIKVGKAIGIGSLWDVYQAKIYLTSSKNPDADYFDVIVKYTSCMDFDGDRHFSDDASNILDRKSALKAVKNDHEFYTRHLSDLQGTVIPVHYGTFIEPQLQVCCMILEDVGTPIGKTTSLGFIDDQDKQTILDIYRIFHSRNILQNGIDRWYVYQAEDGAIRIIDFHRSMKEDKPGIWLEWEERNVRIDCGLARFITFARFKKEFKERQRSLNPAPDPNTEPEIPRKRPRRSTANHSRNNRS